MPFAGAFTDPELLPDLAVVVSFHHIQHKHRMCCRGQAVDQLHDLGGTHLLQYRNWHWRRFHLFQFHMTAETFPGFYMIQSFIYHNPFNPAMQVSFGRIKRMNAFKDLQKCIGKYIRRILFIKGEPVSSDAAEPLRHARQGDLSIILIGSGERFEIPDALVFGG